MPSIPSVTVPRKAWADVLQYWEEALQARYDLMSKHWGGDEHEALWPKLKEHLVSEAGDGLMDEMDVRVLVDNFLVNGEIVFKSEFRECGNDEYYWNRHNGDWDACCKSAIVHTDEYALLRY